MPMDDDRGRGQKQSSPSGMGAGRAAERTTTSSSGRSTGSPGASGGDRDRPSPGSDNRGGGEAAREAADKAAKVAAQKTADDARESQAKADAAAAETRRQMAEATARQEAQARVDAAAAETAAREAQKRQMAEAEQARLDSLARQELTKNLGIPSLMTNTFFTTPMSMPPGLNPTIPGGMMADQKNLFDFGYTDPTSTAMRMQGDTERNLSKLNTLDPSFQTQLSRTLDDTMNAGIGGVTITSGLRDSMEQASIITDRLNKVDPNLASQWSSDVLNIGPEAAGQKYKAEFARRGLFSSPGQQVAMPGESRHQTGMAADMAIDGGKMSDMSNLDVAKFREFALQSGLNFPVEGEAWHVEPVRDRPVENRPTQVARSPFSEGLQETFDTIGAGVKTVADATGLSSVADFFTNKSLRDEIVRDNNRDRQMTSEEVNIAMFNRLHPEAGSNKELYGGRDQTPLPTQVASTTTPPPVVPPVVPTEPVMPTVPNFAAAQQYIGTPTVATPGFNFLMPFAPRPQVDFANLGQAYAPTALASAPPQPLPGIPGAAYATPYQRLG